MRYAQTRLRDEQGRFMSEYRELKCFEVTVWNDLNGDIEEKLWEASQEEVDDVYARFEDEPFISIEVRDKR